MPCSSPALPNTFDYPALTCSLLTVSPFTSRTHQRMLLRTVHKKCGLVVRFTINVVVTADFL